MLMIQTRGGTESESSSHNYAHNILLRLLSPWFCMIMLMLRIPPLCTLHYIVLCTLYCLLKRPWTSDIAVCMLTYFLCTMKAPFHNGSKWEKTDKKVINDIRLPLSLSRQVHHQSLVSVLLITCKLLLSCMVMLRFTHHDTSVIFRRKVQWYVHN